MLVLFDVNSRAVALDAAGARAQALNDKQTINNAGPGQVPSIAASQLAWPCLPLFRRESQQYNNTNAPTPAKCDDGGALGVLGGVCWSVG